MALEIETSESGNQQIQTRRPPLGTALGVYTATTVLIMLGVSYGLSYVEPSLRHPDVRASLDRALVGRLAAWDGVWYARIARDGYTYDPDRMSSVAFFPVYPLAARGLAELLDVPVEVGLFTTAQLALCAAFIVGAFYLTERPGRDTSDRTVGLMLLAMGVFPTTFWWRMSYSESTFLLLTLLAMWAMQRRWPLPAIAVVVGLATATRAVGVALLPCFGYHLWRRREPWRHWLLLPLAAWGLSAYIGWQGLAFGEPLAFVKTQRHWAENPLPKDVADVGWALATLAPFRAVYDPASPCYWANDPPSRPLFSMQCWNAVYVALIWCCVFIGGWRKWLTPPELLLSAGLLLIPYVTHAYSSCMCSDARYASVVFPFYIVLGYALRSVPTAYVGLLAAGCGTALALYAALFVNWYWLF